MSDNAKAFILTRNQFNRIFCALERAEEVSREWDNEGNPSFNTEMNQALNHMRRSFVRSQSK